MAELKNSIVQSNESAAGPDGVHYRFLRYLPESCLHTLLKLFNNIWTTGDIPPSWREASVVPIPKPGKDPSDPSNYRPIALTSCLCKTLERMVNDRLVHVLESRNLWSKVLCGFRKDHSTLDHLVRLETFIKKAFARKKQVLAVFSDLEKAYDTTWRYGILKDLFDLDFRGRLPIFFSNFLKHRHFKVKAENTFSSSYHQEKGVPQGSILSPMFFNLKINNIIKSVSKHVNASLFVDDFAIYAEGKHLQHLERTIQLCINNVQKWDSDNGFRFSVSKTTCVHLHRQRIYTEPALHLDGQPIHVKGEAKFLGVVFDSKLNFSSHVKYLKKKCLKALNLLRVVGHTDWGADRATFLKLYRTLVRSKLDYVSVIYGSAKKHVLRALDPIHHQGLRIALGVFRTTPIKSLYAEAGEPSLEHRRMKLACNYVLKLKSLPRNPCHDILFEESLSDFAADSKS
ncbi:Pol-like protein [Plakobranchus ocellatus]|uniref:Pol-like protein n=1 Tax=Plakobranchus ocellatus TaxID=259542 RepID=A0AAV3YIS1_9GAST|nr:Pol-like protein [Plakobranchus ocellatus]